MLCQILSHWAQMCTIMFGESGQSESCQVKMETKFQNSLGIVASLGVFFAVVVFSSKCSRTEQVHMRSWKRWRATWLKKRGELTMLHHASHRSLCGQKPLSMVRTYRTWNEWKLLARGWL